MLSTNKCKKTWSAITEAIGKEKNCQQSFPKKKNIVEKQQITGIKSIAENFNKYFTEIGPTPEEKVESSTTFYKYLETYNNT